ncbi:MAG: serine hydroxymethyltransferase [Holosporales bacterium]
MIQPSFVQQDPQLAAALSGELERQRAHIELIASENFTSLHVMAAQGYVMTNKYAEGYPGKRYYRGCEYVDAAELLAIERAKELFKCAFANVQPHSGAQANQEVFFTLLNPGDTFLGMSLDAGGHLTHGSKVNLSGRWFNAIGYGVDPHTHLIDMDQVRDLALEHKPKLIIAGGSAYPRIIDFAAFRAIADEVGAYLMVDMAHFSGLVAGGAFPSPLPHAHVVTTTTHKTLRGPRGGMILSNDAELGKKLNSSVFPGIQGGPLMHVIAAKAAAFGEALQPSFKTYAHQVVTNAKVMADEMMQQGFELLTKGTDCHLFLVDLRNQGVTGYDSSLALEQIHITLNMNAIPNDPLPPGKASGIRIGTPAVTTRGFSEADCRETARIIAKTITALKEGTFAAEMDALKARVHALTQRFPLYPEL